MNSTIEVTEVTVPKIEIRVKSKGDEDLVWHLDPKRDGLFDGDTIFVIEGVEEAKAFAAKIESGTINLPGADVEWCFSIPTESEWESFSYLHFEEWNEL